MSDILSWKVLYTDLMFLALHFFHFECICWRLFQKKIYIRYLCFFLALIYPWKRIVQYLDDYAWLIVMCYHYLNISCRPGFLTSYVMAFFCVLWVTIRCDCLFCWYWWNWWPSLFKLSFHKSLCIIKSE